MSTIPQAEGRELLRIEARNAEVPREPRPEWLKTLSHGGSRIPELAQPGGQHFLEYGVCRGQLPQYL